MAVQVVTRRGVRRLVIDIRYTKSDGSPGRFRRDAEVQTMAAARAEDRRRLAALAISGSPTGLPEVGTPPAIATEPPPVVASKPTFDSVAKEYLRTFATSQLKASTRHGYTKIIHGLLIPQLGRLTVDTIDVEQIRKMDALLAARKARPSTRRNAQVVLRSVLCRYAVEAKILAEAPKFPRFPKVGTKVVDTLTNEQFEHLIAQAQSEQRLAFLLAAHAGLRAGEVRGLRWRDVDLDAGVLVVRQSICRGCADTPKSGHDRVVPLASSLQKAFSGLPRRDRDDLVCLNSQGAPWGEFGLRRAFLAACRRAGLEGWRFHDLRHFFVTALFRALVPARSIQELAGHANLTTTQRYAHVTATDLEDAVRRLGQQTGNSTE